MIVCPFKLGVKLQNAFLKQYRRKSSVEGVETSIRYGADFPSLHPIGSRYHIMLLHCIADYDHITSYLLANIEYKCEVTETDPHPCRLFSLSS